MKLRKRTLRFVSDQEKGEAESGGQKRSTPILRRRATEVMYYRFLKKFILIGVSLGAAVLMISYSFALLYNRTGKFSVSVDRSDVMYAITLSETPDFTFRSSRLATDQQVKMTNISGNDIPQNVDSKNGEHSEENILAYTFYCKNVGNAVSALRYEMTFNNVTNHIDEAIRVRLYVDGEYTDYAKIRDTERTDADTGEPTFMEEDFCDETFLGAALVCRKIIKDVEPQEYVRFTVVVWLEGDDPDCVDSIINGKIKFDMTIEAISNVDAE